MPGPGPGPHDPETAEQAVAESDTVEEAAARAAEEADVERPLGAARPDRVGPDGEPLGGEGS
ncbi:MAG TPA: hypothetical protein VK507_12840 [Iamia sp.]|nr:hypothetical protein [Iamia sp.]